MEKEEIQFSIYKISRNQIYDELEDVNEKSSNEEILEKLVFYLECYINKSGGKDKVKINKKDGFTTLLIKSRREPVWKNLITKMIDFDDTDLKDFSIFNHSVSYIMFKIIDEDIYVMTGGRGSNYIGKFIEKNFGLYLLPKLIKNDNPVLRKIVENNTSGNNLTTRRITKNATSLIAEGNIGSIYKELSIQISTELTKKLGIDLEESKKMIGVSSGDSFIIKKSISIETLMTVLTTISELYKKEDNFILNYFVPSEKKRKKKSELNDLLYERIIDGDYKLFEVISDDIDNYYFSSDKYFLKKDDEMIFEKDSPILMDDIIKYIYDTKKDSLSKNYIKNFFNQVQIITEDNNGKTVIYPTKLYDMLRGNLEVEKESFYLLGGTWYVFEDSYFTMLNSQYKDICEQIQVNNKRENVEMLFELKKNDLNEDDYNMSFETTTNIIVAHKSNIKNVEIADLIFWNEETLYLMCNKSKFSGSGMRDLENQIYTSSSIINNAIHFDIKTIESYYDKLRISEQKKIRKTEFVDLFKNRKIVYVAGFSEELKNDTKSVYCQYLLKTIYQQLSTYQFELVVVKYLN